MGENGSTVHRKREECRGCGSRELHRFLALGPTPLANSFLADPVEFAAERSYPLDVYLCERCSLVQLLDVIDPEVLFREYIYVTGTSSTIAEHNRRYAKAVVDHLGAGPADTIMEVASNDGSLLRCFRELGVRTLGIEPAKNIAAIARSTGIETVDEFFGLDLARRLRAERGPAKAVIGNNVLAHVDDTRGFLAGFRELLGPDGMAITEVPYLGELVDRLEYDTVYHEHLCYFSITALMNLCASVGLSIRRIDHVPVHGGSIRVWAARAEGHGGHAPEVTAAAAAERGRGLTDAATFDRFAADVSANRDAIRGLLKSIRERGATIAAYGAPAKGNTLLNYCGLTADDLPWTVDRNPLKVGRYTPGSHIPVLPVEALVERQPDYALILAWNFADEIIEQQREYVERGGRFIVPVPEPRIIGA